MGIKRAIYPGSFDPITKGHANIIKKALKIFDEVIVVVSKNINKKNSFFSVEERVELIKKMYENNSSVKVIESSLASVDVALENNCNIIIRGLRNLSDYNYELELAKVNRDLSNNEIETICFFADSEEDCISSSMVKEIFTFNKDISKYVDDIVIEKMEEKLMN